jgi:endonuclease/exonuclease/phosphatase family metal-dependent hydrolase
VRNFTLAVLLTVMYLVPAIPGRAAVRPSISIATVNMAKEADSDRVLREWRAVPALRNADVFLLQEVDEEPGRPSIANRLAAALGFHVAYSPEAPGVRDRGLAILSRFPLSDIQKQPLKPFNLVFHSRARFALSATVTTPWGAVRVSDLHLDTRLNTSQRLAQLDPVLHDKTAFTGRRVVAGDFNSNPFYWIDHVLPVPAFRSQARGVYDFMRGRHFQSAIAESATTSDYLGMHLDWIWVSGLRPAASRVTPLGFSDHHAVWTRLEF